MKAFTQKLISLTKAVVAFEEKNDNVSSVESQTEASRQAGSIWNATRMGNKEEVMRLLAKNPALVTTRGPVGEVPLHLCFLYNAPAHLEIAEAMMDAYPHVIPEQYIGDEYGGENVLHIAIIQKNYAWAKRLVAMCPALMKGAATGRFFRHGEPCYYGEYPLAFAACTNQPDMVQTLIEAGADMNIVDSHGNTLLHLLVIHNLPKMYALCKQGWIERYQEHNTTLDKAHRAPELWLRKNSDGHTPFTLAASMGQKNMFSFLLEERKIVQWTYGPVSCVLYPLDQLDLAARLADYKPEAEIDASQQGALEHIVNAAHLDLLMHPRIIDLVQRKWDCFANRIFIQRFIIVAIYLFIFTVTTITRQTYYHRLEETQALHEAQAATAASQGLPPPEIDWNEYSPPWSLYVGYVIVLFGAIYKALREVTEMSQSGVANYFSSSGSAFLENLLSLSFSACIMLVVILHILGSPAERAVLALASICGYSYILFFLLGFRLTGPMVVMIYEMLFNDVLRFCITYSVFLFGFAQAFFILFDSVGVSGFGESIKTCFVAMLGDFDFSTYSESPFQSVSVGLLVIYVVVVTILLLNLLIAMMGDTYGRINENAEKQWELERARIVFAIENEMSSEERNHISNKYFTLVDGERYLQIQEVNRNHFRDPDDPAVTPSDDSD